MVDADFSYFAWARVWQMVGLPLLFIPINMVAYAGLPAEKTNQASALINVARNLGGSLGVSLANAVVAQRALPSGATDRASGPVLVELSGDDPPGTEFFQSHGASPTTAQHQAIGWVGQLVQSQSALLAYIDVFWAYAVFAALMVPLALFLLRRIDRSTPNKHPPQES